MAPTKKPAAEPTFLAPHLAILEGLGIQARVARRAPPGAAHAEPDAWLRLEGPWGHGHWAGEVKTRLERGTAGPVIERMKRMRDVVPHALLLTEYVTPPLGDELRKQGIEFVDAAGNAFLAGDGLYVWVTGKPPRRARGARRGLHAAGIKLVFVLLQQRRRRWNLRELARDAGIGLGGVAGILTALQERNWIRRVRDEVELQDPEAMLKRWDEGFADALRPKLVLARCRRRPGTEIEALPALIEDTGVGAILGGELGAGVLTRYLRPQTATLHVLDADLDNVMRKLALLPDPAGDVQILATFGATNGARQNGIADPLLVRAELLLHPDDRLREVAEILRAQHIVVRWE